MKVLVDNQRPGAGQQGQPGASYWRKRNDKVIMMDIKRAGPQQYSPHKSTTGNMFASQAPEMMTPNRNKSPSYMAQPQPTALDHPKRASISSFSPHDNIELENLRRENQKLKDLCQRQQNTISHLEGELLKASERENSLGRNSTDYSRKNSQLEEELSQAQRAVRNLEFELESKKKEISERDRDKSLLESTIADKDKKLKDVEARELQAKKEIDDAKRDNDERKRKMADMEDEKRRLLLRIEEIETLQKKQVTSIGDEKDRLEKEIKELRERLQQVEKASQEKEFVLSRMCSQIMDLNKTRTQVDKEAH